MFWRFFLFFDFQSWRFFFYFSIFRPTLIVRNFLTGNIIYDLQNSMVWKTTTRTLSCLVDSGAQDWLVRILDCLSWRLVVTANRSNFDGNFALSSCFADWLPYMSGNFFENFFVKYEVKFVLEVILWNEGGVGGWIWKSRKSIPSFDTMRRTYFVRYVYVVPT